jgi:hypothetical protein
MSPSKPHTISLRGLSLVIIALLVPVKAGAQEIPSGVKYKKASDEINQKARTILKNALGPEAEGANLEALSDGAIACGPLLWDALKGEAGKELLEAKPLVLMIGTKPPLMKEGRGIRTPEEKRAFWKLFIEKIKKGSTATVRKAEASEIQYFWATISFDIEEPLYIADFGKQRVLFNFTVKNGELKIFWMDIVGSLATLSSTAKPSGPANRQDEPPPAPRVLEDKSAPEGWKRYQFDYNGGDLLSVIMPSAPREYAGKGQVATDVLIRMMTHSFSANTKTESFNALYVDDLSIPSEKMSENQKNIFYDALWDGFAKGMVNAFKDAGQTVEAKALETGNITIGDYKGIEQNFSVGPFHGRARIVLAGKYAYMALATWTSETPAEQVEAFFNSFKIRRVQ